MDSLPTRSHFERECDYNHRNQESDVKETQHNLEFEKEKERSRFVVNELEIRIESRLLLKSVEVDQVLVSEDIGETAHEL